MSSCSLSSRSLFLSSYLLQSLNHARAHIHIHEPDNPRLLIFFLCVSCDLGFNFLNFYFKIFVHDCQRWFSSPYICCDLFEFSRWFRSSLNLSGSCPYIGFITISIRINRSYMYFQATLDLKMQMGIDLGIRFFFGSIENVELLWIMAL